MNDAMNPNSQTQSGGANGNPPGAVPRPASRKPRRWVPYIAGAVLLALLVAGLWPKPTAVETAVASVGPLRVVVAEEGRTRVRQRYVVHAPIPGQLRRIPYKAGEPVTAGKTLLAIIDPLQPAPLDERARAAAEAREESASAQLSKAQAEQAFATSELKRFEALYANKTIAAQEFESVQLRKTAADRNVSAAESALKQARAELAEFSGAASTTNQPAREIVAPVSGKVLRVFEESARSVTPGLSLVEIGDPADLEAVIEVLSRDGAIIQPGMPVELEQWGGGEPLEARVRLVEPAGFTKISALGVEEQRVNVIADILTPVEKRGNLGDGFRVEARIVVWQSPKTLKVPSGALFRRGEGWAVFVIDNGVAKIRDVKAGKTSGREFQILEGLKEGETVIIYPSGKVKEGAKVRPIQL